MADKKISALTPASTPLAGSEVLPIVQGGVTVKVSADNLWSGRVVTSDGFRNQRPGVSSQYIEQVAAGGGTFLNIVNNANAANMSYQVVRTTTSGTTYPLLLDSNDNLQVQLGNIILGTAGKGITTGGAIALGLGTNNSVTAVTISTSSNLLVGTTVDAGALANTQAITAGKFQTFSGETASLVNGATENIAGLVSGAAYLVSCRGSANSTTFVIHTVYVDAAGGVTLATLSNGNGFVLTSPANNTLQVTGLVTTQTYPYTITRIF